MTVFGIGGCMGLMLVGYGIKDSCYEIAELQFRDIQMYDGSVYLKEDISDEIRQNLLDYMKDDSDISHYMQTSMKNVTLVNGKNKRDTYQVVFSEPKDVKIILISTTGNQKRNIRSMMKVSLFLRKPESF